MRGRTTTVEEPGGAEEIRAAADADDPLCDRSPPLDPLNEPTVARRRMNALAAGDNQGIYRAVVSGQRSGTELEPG